MKKCTNITNITMTNTTFRNANEAYEYLHDKIIQEGINLTLGYTFYLRLGYKFKISASLVSALYLTYSKKKQE